MSSTRTERYTFGWRFAPRLTVDEMAVIQKMATDERYRHVPTSRLSVLAGRLGKVFASPTTGYRLVREREWSRPRLRRHPRPPPKEGIRASGPDEIWHIDTSQLRCVGCLVSQTVGASGGSVTSDDGKLTLTFPAGALAADTEITIEGTAPANLDDEFDPLAPDEGYALGPDGLTFPVPVRATYESGEAPLQEDGAIVAGVGALFTSENGIPEALDNQSTAIDISANAVRSHGELSHFSELVASDKHLVFAVRGVADSCPVGGLCFTAHAELAIAEGVDASTILEPTYTDFSRGQIRPTAPPIVNVPLVESAPKTFTGDFDYSCEPNLGDPDEFVATGRAIYQRVFAGGRIIDILTEVDVRKPIPCVVEQACSERPYPQCGGACPSLSRCLPNGDLGSCECVPLVDICGGFAELQQCNGVCPVDQSCAEDPDTTWCECVPDPGCGNDITEEGEQCDGEDDLSCVGGECGEDCVCENACDGSGDCTGGFACLFGLCIPECDGSDDCADGGTCSVPGNVDETLTPGCFPGIPDGAPEGEPCFEHEECFSFFCEAVLGECASFCLLEDGEPNLDVGVPAINGNAGCDGGFCVEFYFSQGRGVCGTSCTSDADCGEGRVCRLARDSEQNLYRAACFLASDTRADAGEPCATNAECNSSNCMTPPAVQSACFNNGDCGGGEYCTPFRRCALPVCTAHCESNADCLPALPNCVALDIPTPDGVVTQDLNVCGP